VSSGLIGYLVSRHIRGLNMRGDRLKDARESRQFSQKDLAERIGSTDKQIWRYENGLNDPTADVLTRIAKVLEVSLDYLVGLVDEPTEHFREDDLTAMERRLIMAVREGRIVEALKAFTAVSEKIDQPSITPDKKAVNG
jgi:transcriptional regulator with XRE-family HTH domain